MKSLLLLVLALSVGASDALAQRESDDKPRRKTNAFYFHDAPDVSVYRWPGDGFRFNGDRFMLDADTLLFRHFRNNTPRAFYFDGDGFGNVFAFGGSYFFDEEVREMERRSRELAAQAREAEGSERTRIERELDELLVQIFERKQQLRAEQIEELESRLRALQGEQQERLARQREIIERRKRQLLGEEDPLRW